jgi:hypothetical protein
MLKPPDQGGQPERPIGELVRQLIDDGKAYALAELAVAKAVGKAKARAFGWPVGLLLMALIVLQSAVTILVVGIFMALLRPLGPILAAIVASAVFCAVAGGLGWYGIERMKREL